MGMFILTQKAKDDLLGIGRYTRKQWGKVQQRRYLTQLDSAFHDLADKPL
jgi:toxin ParE1/3/4